MVARKKTDNPPLRRVTLEPKRLFIMYAELGANVFTDDVEHFDLNGVTIYVYQLHEWQLAQDKSRLYQNTVVKCVCSDCQCAIYIAAGMIDQVLQSTGSHVHCMRCIHTLEERTEEDKQK